jgi:alpha-galactosidase
VEQAASWKKQLRDWSGNARIELSQSREYAATIMHSVVTGEPSVIYGNVANRGFIPQLPQGCAVEVPCLVDALGIQPTVAPKIPPQLVALIRTNVNVQELTVAALMNEDRRHVYHAAMLDPHAAAELDLDQIRQLVDALLETHGSWLPEWLAGRGRAAA